MTQSTAGCRAVGLIDPEMELPFPLLVLYPSHSPERPDQFGPYTLNVSLDAPVAAGVFPLVVASRGTGGSHLVYRTLAEHGRHSGPPPAAHPPGRRLGVRGPRHRPLPASRCADHHRPLAGRLYGAGRGRRTPPAGGGDSGPARAGTGPAGTGGLPILLWTGEKDQHTPARHAGIVRQGVPDPALIEHRVAGNGGHFAFLSPIPAEMVSPAFPPSQDAAGFDRARFHEKLNAGVLDFVRRVTAAR